MKAIDSRLVARVAAIVLGMASASCSVDLTIGDRAPGFELPGSDGTTHRLIDYAGKQVVVLAWFPKAFTGG